MHIYKQKVDEQLLQTFFNFSNIFFIRMIFLRSEFHIIRYGEFCLWYFKRFWNTWFVFDFSHFSYFYIFEVFVPFIPNLWDSALRAFPAVTRLTVHRRSQVSNKSLFLKRIVLILLHSLAAARFTVGRRLQVKISRKSWILLSSYSQGISWIIQRTT